VSAASHSTSAQGRFLEDKREGKDFNSFPSSIDLFLNSLDHIIHLHQFIVSGLQNELLHWTTTSSLLSLFLQLSYTMYETYQYGLSKSASDIDSREVVRSNPLANLVAVGMLVSITLSTVGSLGQRPRFLMERSIK
jgi:hypothetical protein